MIELIEGVREALQKHPALAFVFIPAGTVAYFAARWCLRAIWRRLGRKVPESEWPERIQLGQMRTGAEPPITPLRIHNPQPLAPYAPIEGRGEAPVNPLEARVAALESRFDGMCNWMCNAAPRLTALEVARLEAGGEGDGWRVFQGGAYFIIISDELQMWSRLAGRKHWQDYGFFGTYEQALSRWHTYAELHGPERAEIVRAFREWKNS